MLNKIRNLSQTGWTPLQDEQLKRLYPKYGNDIYKYIKGHNLKDCLIRAEILGVKYIEPSKEEPQAVLTKKPFRLDRKKMDSIPEVKTLPKKLVNSFIGAYITMIVEGRASISRKLLEQVEALKEAKVDDESIKNILLGLWESCVKTTVINDVAANKEVLSQRQETFKNYITSYIDSHNKKSSNIVILGGKAHAEATKKDIDAYTEEKKNQSRIRIEDMYVGKKRSVAGVYGDTIMEHVLIKTYAGMLKEDYTVKNVEQLVKEYTAEEVMKKIENLRDSRMPWTNDEISAINSGAKNIDLYKILLRGHSDLDILEKAKELGSKSLTSYSINITKAFEKNYNEFINKYKEAVAKIEYAKERTAWEAQRAETNRQKKAAAKERLKNLKPTVMVVKKKKIKNT